MSAEGMEAAILAFAGTLPGLGCCCCRCYCGAAGAARCKGPEPGWGSGRGGVLLAGWRGWVAVKAADDFRHIEAWVAGVRHPSLPTRTPRRPEPSCSSLALPVATVTLQAEAGKEKKNHPNLECFAKSPSPFSRSH